MAGRKIEERQDCNQNYEEEIGHLDSLAVPKVVAAAAATHHAPFRLRPGTVAVAGPRRAEVQGA